MRYGELQIYKLDGNMVTYDVEIPENEEEFTIGFSYKDFIPDKTGMLYYFLIWYPQISKMFTASTVMPVDFIFIDNAGTIIKIHKNAKPLSEKIISCYSVGAVLEVNAGDCDKYGINVGDIALILSYSKNKIFLPLNKQDLKYKQLGKTIYATDSQNKYYMYSYKSHCWLEVDNDYEKNFKEIIQILNIFKEEKSLSANEANDFAINYDKQLLFNFRKYKKVYYQTGKYLFYEYTPETGDFRFYKFNSGWIGWEHTDISYDSFQALKEKSQILTKKDVEDLIIQVEKDLSETEIDNINNENEEQYRNFRFGMFEYCECFYKQNNSSGWLYSTMDGNEKICEMKLEELKKNKEIYDYRIFANNNSIWRRGKELFPTIPSARETHMRSSLIIMPNEDKMYFDYEIVKEPSNEVKESKNFTMKFRQSGWVSFDSSSFDSEEDVYSEAYFSIKTDYQQVYRYAVITDDIIADIPNFIKNLDKNNFAVIQNEEYAYFKMLAWKHKNDKIRFIFQDYNSDDVITEIDTIMENKIFQESFKKLEKSFERLHKKNLEDYKEYKEKQKNNEN